MIDNGHNASVKLLATCLVFNKQSRTNLSVVEGTLEAFLVKAVYHVTKLRQTWISKQGVRILAHTVGCSLILC